MKKRLLSIFLTLAMVLCFAPTIAFAEDGESAAEYDLAEGSIAVAVDENGTQTVTQVINTDDYGVIYSSPIVSVQSGTIIIKQSNSTTYTENTITVDVAENQSATVVLSGVNIKTDSDAAVTVTGAGDATIELMGSNAVESGIGYAGVQKDSTGELTITAADTNQNLTATGGGDAAGIGGGLYGNGSGIIISGGKVTAIGQGGGAGIGGGDSDANDSFGEGSNITITAGEVTAIGDFGAGIGGGIFGNGSHITISGGKVKAIGRNGGAGIGGGHGGIGSNITISGGEVTAASEHCGAGIGSGCTKDGGSNIVISGSARVKVKGGMANVGIKTGAAIGGGSTCNDDRLTWVEGKEVAPDTSGLNTEGWIEYYAPNMWIDDMEAATPTKTVACGAGTHDWDSGTVTKQPTCTEEGETTYTCVACKGTKTEPIAQLAHTLVQHDAKEATVTEVGNTEYWQCDVCDKYFSDENAENEISAADTVIAKLAPTIIAGDGATVTQGEKKALSFTSDAAMEDFLRVEVDGKTVGESSYTVTSGSTVVTLNADYVAAVSVGEHTLGIVSQSGTATAKFSVIQKAAETTDKTDKPTTGNNTKAPQTGDGSNLVLWTALLFISGGTVIGTTVVSRKKKYNR